MSYLVLARKYRPKTFDEVIGQESAATTLKNAVTSGRVAHAYLFTGPRGVGKTSMARILAKALNCKQGPTPTPCNACEICARIDSGDDVDVIEIDGASNRGIDEIRSLRDNARYAPARSRFKIYVIDEVHMLTKDAFNALLKTLEEPPPHVKFIFATTEPHKLLDTIRSRCQRFDFRRIPTTLIAQHLAKIAGQENIKAAPGVLDTIARNAHGGLRDAESLLDQLTALATEEITLRDLEQLTGAVSPDTLLGILRAVAEHDARKAIELTDDALARGAADDELLQQLIESFRELLLARVAGPDSPLIDRTESERQGIAELAPKFTADALLYLVQMFAETKQKARDSSQSRVVIELALIKAAEIHDLRPLDEILARLRALEASGPAPAARPADAAGGAPHGATGHSLRTPAPPRTHGPTHSAADTSDSSDSSDLSDLSDPSDGSAARPRPPAPARSGQLWPDTLALLEQKKPPLAHFISEAVLHAPDSAEPDAPPHYVLELPPVALEQARAHKDLIRDTLIEVGGVPCTLDIRSTAPARPAAAPPAPQTVSTEPRSGHIKKAMALFGARVVTTTDQPAAPRPTNESRRNDEGI